MQWIGLGNSIAKLLRNLPPETLLAEDKVHNVKPENTASHNLLICGDNLEVLKHLKNTYRNQVKIIYIDPPYNKGSNGFVYQKMIVNLLHNNLPALLIFPLKKRDVF